ncbi:hypothetical protein V5799_011355 [Amblyomma americanum]|uniref:Uncharacterized protein n=1 Tax=Amblyomma americanum TaxID=6943 RepID=A0AAQ4EH50_AMBAM
MRAGKGTPLKKSSKGTSSPRSRTSGGSDSLAGQGLPTDSPVSPLKPRDEHEKVGSRSARNVANSPAKRGDSPLNLSREEPPQKPSDKISTHLDASSPRLKTNTGQISPKSQGSPKREPSPIRTESMPKPGGSLQIPEEPQTKHGGALSTDDHGLKAELDAGSPKAEAGSRQPEESQRRPAGSLKDPPYRYAAPGLIAERGRRHSASRGGSGRASPTLRSPGAPVYASEDDATVYERGSSVVRLAAEARGQKRRSGTWSPASPQR